LKITARFGSIMKKIAITVGISFGIGLVCLSVAFVVYKPIRVLWPEVVGLKRTIGDVYVDDERRGLEAGRLLDVSIEEINGKGFYFKKLPRILFCTDQRKYELLGFKESAARTIDGLAIVVGPRGSQSFYLKHELIHYWQHENLGWSYSWRYPAWLVEGMAYSLSDDPRHPIAQPWESYRTRFEVWFATNKNIVEEASKLYRR
jgi:hypothetical protein